MLCAATGAGISAPSPVGEYFELTGTPKMLAKSKYLVILKSKDLLVIQKKKIPSDSGLPVDHVQLRE